MTTEQKGSPVSAEIKHRTIKTNGINLHIAEAGEGPLVLLVHGFPELWYSWRHQIPAIAEAGFHVVAPDVRGYGDSDKPEAIEAYAMKEHIADLLGILDEAGEKQAVIVGHDWGAPMAWNSAALYPDRYRAVVALSIPYLPRSPMPPIQMMKAMFQDNFFYILYFQEPGVAEAEFEADVDGSMRQFTWGASAEGRNIPGFANAMMGKKNDQKLFEGFPHMEGLPPWITEEEHAYYVEKFKKSGFRGLYFVLGGTIPLASEELQKFARVRELILRVERDGSTLKLSEVILGLSATTEGDHTRQILAEKLRPMSEGMNFKLSSLGRGLSTGSELEYADPDTIASALSSRS